MTEFNVLKYAAAAVALAAILAFLLVWDGAKGFGAALRSQSWLLVGIPLQIVYTIVGYLVGLGAMLALMAATMLYLLADLWFKDSPKLLASVCHHLRMYRQVRAHQPAH